MLLRVYHDNELRLRGDKLKTYPDPRHAGLARHHVVSRNEKVHEISRDFTRERESFGTNKLRVMETTVRITP